MATRKIHASLSALPGACRRLHDALNDLPFIPSMPPPRDRPKRSGSARPYLTATPAPPSGGNRPARS